MGITARASVRRIGPPRPACRQDYAGPGAGRADLCTAANSRRRATPLRSHPGDQRSSPHSIAGWYTATGPISVMTSRSGRWPRRNTLAAFRGLEIGMLARKSATLASGLSQKRALPFARFGRIER